MNNFPLRQTLYRRAEYRKGVKTRIYLGLFIVICVTNLLYNLFH